MILKGRKIYQGKVSGTALSTKMAISFYGGVDPDTGFVTERDHELNGLCISGRILVFPRGKGSTVGSYTLYRLKKNGLAPSAIINRDCETITAVGCIISEIPCIDQVDIDQLETGMKLLVDGENGSVLIVEN